MAKIAFSMAGEGRGHATRVKSVVEALRGEHELILLAPSAAHDLLEQAYRHIPGVSVTRIPGLHFQYRADGRLDYLKTMVHNIPYIRSMSKRTTEIKTLLRQESVDFAITDFEPLLPKAAEKMDIPYISFDHQHFLVINDLSSLPWHLRWKAWLMGLTVKLYYRRQRRTIVSSFYSPPIKSGYGDAVQTGVLLRPEIRRAKPTHGDHILVYMRRFMRDNLLDALRQCGREVRVYGLAPKPDEANIRYLAVDENRFLNDLTTCDAVVSNAGNQLVGEALYLGKPMLALPETGNFEQAINAHYLRASGCGDWIGFERVDASDLRRFLSAVPAMRHQIQPEKFVGNDEAVKTIKQEIALALKTA